MDPTAPAGGPDRLAPFADGRTTCRHLRGPNATGPRAIVLSQLDTSKPGRPGPDPTLPAVVILVALAGAPIVVLLARSTARSDARAAATADARRGGPAAPARRPSRGPRADRLLNAMAAELTDTRDRETRPADIRQRPANAADRHRRVRGGAADGTATGEGATRAARAIGEEAARLSGCRRARRDGAVVTGHRLSA